MKSYLSGGSLPSVPYKNGDMMFVSAVMKQENLILIYAEYTASMRMIWSRGIICMWRNRGQEKPAVIGQEADQG